MRTEYRGGEIPLGFSFSPNCTPHLHNPITGEAIRPLPDGDAGLRSVRHQLAQRATAARERVDLRLAGTIWLWASLQPVVPLLRGSDGGFVGPASQALSLPWFATD